MESNDKPQTEAAQATERAQASSAKRKCLLRGILLLSLILLILAPAAGALWLSYQQQARLQQLETALHELQGLKGDIETVESQLNRASRELESSQAQLGEVLQRQQASILELQKKSPLSSAEIEFRWALAEIEYLLELANQRTILAKDAAGAEQALALADEILQHLNDYRLQPLRELVAEEMLALAARGKVDTPGMTAQLQSIIQAVDTLRVVRGPRQFTADNTPVTADNSETAGWREAVDAIWQQVRSLVVIRQQEGAPQAVLMPEQRYFLYQNLKLQLESARFALLSGHQKTYENSLTSAIDWLTRYFTGDERDAVLSSLHALKAQQIVVEMPEISGSLRWIQRFEP